MGLIYLDTCVVIYAFEGDSKFGDTVRKALKRAASAHRFAISPLVKLECLVAPMRSGNLLLRRHYEEGLAQFELLTMPEAVYYDAAQLRASFGLRTPDALHLATAQHHRCSALWTNDDRLAQAAHGLSSNIMSPRR